MIATFLLSVGVRIKESNSNLGLFQRIVSLRSGESIVCFSEVPVVHGVVWHAQLLVEPVQDPHLY